MATVQLPNDETTPQFKAPVRLVVQVKKQWADEWTLIDYIEPIALTEAAI